MTRGPGHLYSGLDGLRGIAALAVASMHLYDVNLRAFDGTRLPAFLAVDFFFMLSGFVLAHAYGERLGDGMSVRSFMLLRWIRLYPMLCVGLLAGGAASLGHYLVTGSRQPFETAGPFVASFTLLPIGLFQRWLGLPHPAGNPFLFDWPIWSLAYEFIASAFFAVWGWRLSGKLGWAIWTASAIVWSSIFIRKGAIDEFGLLPDLLAGGLLRLFVPFILGILLARVDASNRLPRIPIVVPAIVLAIFLLVPLNKAQFVQDFLCLYLVFPMLIILGAAARPGGGMLVACRWLGALSYPLYLCHLPVSRGIAYLGRQLTHEPMVLFLVSLAGSTLVAWVVLKLIDEPVRRWLIRRLT